MLVRPTMCDGGRAARIEAALLGAEADAGNAELHDVALLLRASAGACSQTKPVPLFSLW